MTHTHGTIRPEQTLTRAEMTTGSQPPAFCLACGPQISAQPHPTQLQVESVALAPWVHSRVGEALRPRPDSSLQCLGVCLSLRPCAPSFMRGLRVCVQLFVTTWTMASLSPLSVGILLGKNAGMGATSPPEGIFQSQGREPSLLQWQVNF